MAFVILVIASTSFVQGLAVAITSALVSGGFLLIATHMTMKKVDIKNEIAKEEIKQVVKEEHK